MGEERKGFRDDVRKEINLLLSHMWDKWGVDDDDTLSIIQEEFL